jgi:hypothetical protein
MATEQQPESVMTKKRRATHVQVVEIADLLRAKCHSGVNGTAVYDDGWNDLRITEAVDFDCAESSVAGIRRDLIGDLYKTSGNGATSEEILGLAIKIREAQNHTYQLQQEHNDLVKQIGLLLLELKINHGIKVESQLVASDGTS